MLQRLRQVLLGAGSQALAKSLYVARADPEQVAGGTLPLLGTLLDKSLLRRNGLG